jgi:hypothetical protein
VIEAAHKAASFYIKIENRNFLTGITVWLQRLPPRGVGGEHKGKLPWVFFAGTSAFGLFRRRFRFSFKKILSNPKSRDSI